MEARGLVRVAKTEVVYSGEVRLPEGYSLVDTLRTYSFGWQFDGRRGYLHLCWGCVVALEERDGYARFEVYCIRGERCWEGEVGAIEDAIGVRDDYEPFLHRARGDPLVGGVAEAMPGLRLRRSSVWYALLVAICQQNASFRVGWRMLYKLHLLTSRRLLLPGGAVYLEPPHPSSLREEVLRQAGLGYRASTVMEVVRSAAWAVTCSNVDELAAVRGVGRYTLNLVKLLACKDFDALPLDRWLAALASEAYGVTLRSIESELSSRFPGWRGVAALWATIGFDAEPLRRALERLRRGLNMPGLVEPSPVSLWKYTPPK